jgi:hypothetical protein
LMSVKPRSVALKHFVEVIKHTIVTHIQIWALWGWSNTSTMWSTVQATWRQTFSYNMMMPLLNMTGHVL